MAKKLILLFLIVILPFSFFLFFSTGKHQFKPLPYYGPSQNGNPFVYSDFSLAGENTPVTKESLKGKIIIANVLQPGCPFDCLWDARLFKFTIYNELVQEEKMKDVLILSQVTDSSSAGFLSQMPNRLGVEEEHWKFYYAEKNPFAEIEINGKKYSDEVNEKNNNPLYYTTAFVIDSEFHLRGVYDISKSVDMLDLLSAIRLMIKEENEK